MESENRDGWIGVLVVIAVIVAIAVIVFLLTHDIIKISLPSPPASQSPTTSVNQPTPAPTHFRAVCNDGTPWWGQHRNGACSRHMGVKEWLPS
jgi:Protein of unknown function (DUF3761)